MKNLISRESSLVTVVVLAVVVGLVFALDNFLLASADKCYANVSPITMNRIAPVNCSEVACSWNRALEWCGFHRDNGSEWIFVLGSGMYSFSEDDLVSPLQIPVGMIYIYTYRFITERDVRISIRRYFNFLCVSASLSTRSKQCTCQVCLEFFSSSVEWCKL